MLVTTASREGCRRARGEFVSLRLTKATHPPAPHSPGGVSGCDREIRHAPPSPPPTGPYPSMPPVRQRPHRPDPQQSPLTHRPTLPHHRQPEPTPRRPPFANAHTDPTRNSRHSRTARTSLTIGK